MDINEKIQYWQALSADDLDSAKIMLKKKKFLQTGFYCHQAVEKMIKAYFWFNKRNEPPYTHNLLKLSGDSGLASFLSDDHKRHMDLLMPLNIEARYPDDKINLMKTLNAVKSKMIFKKTEELTTWILTLIKK